MKPHKDRGLKITEQDLEELRKFKHEENLQKPSPKRRYKRRKGAQKRASVGKEEILGEKEDFEKQYSEDK